MEPDLVAAIIGGAGLFGVSAYFLGRKHVAPPIVEDEEIIISSDLRHEHTRWKKGPDDIYFCVECLDRYLDGKPK
jgi:hypothetical protein